MTIRRAVRIYVPLALFLVFLLLPFLWMLLTTFKSNRELLDSPNPFWIFHFTFEHVTDLLTQTAYLQWFANTLFVSVASTIVSVFVSYITAYAIIRLRFPGWQVVSTAIFLAYIVPPAILFIPLATIIIQLHWFDHLWALVPIYATFLVPFCTWLLIGFLKNVPRELEEAARVDGASNVAILWRIIFPSPCRA